MTLKAFDTDGSPNLAGALALGYQACGLYLGRTLTAAVMEQAAQLGMGLFAFGEFESYNPLRGASQGETDARQLVSWAKEIGWGGAIYVANDESIPSTADWDATLAYFAAVAPILTDAGLAPGLYGQTVLWERIVGYGYKYFAHAPDGTTPPAFANIVCDVPPNVTLAGMYVDLDVIQTPADFGGWNAAGAWPKPDPPAPLEADMYFSWDKKTYFVSGGKRYQLTKNGLKAVQAAEKAGKIYVIPDIEAGLLNTFAAS